MRTCTILALAAAPLLLASDQTRATGTLSRPPFESRLALGQPSLVDGRLVFPQGEDALPVPRYLTESERRYLELHPLVAGQADGGGGGMLRGPYTAPTGEVRCPGEYEPCDGILVSWKSFTTLLTQMGVRITNEGNAKFYVACDSAATRTSATTALTNAGANMSRVEFMLNPGMIPPPLTDSVWMRDYGPRYVYEGNARAIIDHTYNRPRPIDNVFPAYFGVLKNQARYILPLIHGGGNYHLNGIGDSWATRLIANENPSLTEPQIIAYWNQFQNVGTTLTTPFPTTVDLTQHIDMWMQITGDNSAIIADWPSNIGSAQDVICDNTAAAMTADGWTIARVPGRSLSGVHYTYTNAVMCNDIVLVPRYTNTTIVAAGHNAVALAAWQAHMPGKQIFQLDCQLIIPSAGAIHCIAMHVPRHLGAAGPGGGLAPTAYLRNLRGGDSLLSGGSIDIRWISDDDVSVSSIDILLSTDGGASYPTTIAAATAPDGTHTWIVPSVITQQARVRVVARDALGNTGFDESPADFAISCEADFDENGAREVTDIFAFLSAWFAEDPSADFDGTPGIGVPDIFAFLSLWFAGC